MKAGLLCAGGGRYMARNDYPWIDWFRLPAALLVIAIHTAPFASVAPLLDVLITYGLARTAVPFFFMTTGYFVLGSVGKDGPAASRPYRQFLKKTCLLYGGAVLLYVPVMWYAQKMPSSIPELLKMLVFDGTFYHLWYFPALLVGSVVTVELLTHVSRKTAAAVTGLLYVIGLLGDSYYGLTAAVSALKGFYDVLFQISSYTRNGIFYAPVFLCLGALLRQKDSRDAGAGHAAAAAAGIIVLLAESYLTDRYGLAKHNSMYAVLPLLMYAAYPLLLKGEGTAPALLRRGTAFLYIIHPIAILLVRGAAGVLGKEALLVEQSLVHYAAVVLVSLLLMVYYLYAVRVVEYRKRRKAVQRR